MEFLSDDPTYLAGGLGLLACLCLLALKVTQRGKFLIWAGAAMALAMTVMVVERFWVTDNERIEATVYQLARAVENADVEGVLDLLTPDVQYVVHDQTMSSAFTRGKIAMAVKTSRFDFLKITHLKASAGGQSRRGRAEFRVLCSGSFGSLNFGSVRSVWSLGLRETSPRVWKVNRISPVDLPGGQAILPTAQLHRDLEPAFVSPPAEGHRHGGRGRGAGAAAGPGPGRRSAAAMLDPPELPPAIWEP